MPVEDRADVMRVLIAEVERCNAGTLFRVVRTVHRHVIERAQLLQRVRDDLDLVSADDEIGVASFASSGGVDFMLASAGTSASAAKDEIDLLSASGGTNVGGGLNAGTIPEIRAAIIAGAANNQLASAADADRLHRRGILYAPDFAINAGGVIAIALGRPGVSERRVVDKAEAIGITLRAIFARARAENRATAHIADQLAEERLVAAGARSAA